MFISNERDKDTISIPMFAMGTNTCVKTRTPTQEELNSCPHVTLTSDIEWEPNNTTFPKVNAIRRDIHMEKGSVPGEIYNVVGFSQRLVAKLSNSNFECFNSGL